VALHSMHAQEAEDNLPCIKAALCAAAGATAATGSVGAHKVAAARLLLVVDNADDPLTEDQAADHGQAAMVLFALLQVGYRGDDGCLIIHGMAARLPIGDGFAQL
jgi:hypothetical protein